MHFVQCTVSHEPFLMGYFFKKRSLELVKHLIIMFA